MKTSVLILLTSIILGHGLNNKAFKPDIKINGIELRDTISLTSKIPGVNQMIDHSGPGARVYISNIDKSELLTLVFHSGDYFNMPSEFHISTLRQKVHVHYILKEDHFCSESGIYLGMKMKDLFLIKGDHFTRDSNTSIEIIEYLINDFDSSEFLQYYNMHEYVARYYFDDKVLINFEYGFPYP